MSNDHHKSAHHEHHESAHHEHHVAPKEETILGFGVKTIAVIAVLIIATAIIATWVGYGAGLNNSGKSVVPVQGGSGVVTKVDTLALKTKVQDYINTNLLVEPNISAKITDVNDAGNGLYALGFEIYEGTSVVSSGVIYSNNDKLLIGNAFDLNKPLEKPKPPEPVKTEVVKSDKPVVDLYVMSFCPYGNKAEDTMLPVYNLLKEEVEFNINFIVNTSGDSVSSLHGNPEVVQNEREACVLKNYDLNKMLNFMVYVNDNCGSNGSCWENGAKALGIDTKKITDCVASDGLALMKASEAASNEANASGSPTMLINGVPSTAVYAYGNSEAYKAAICAAFNNAPADCSVALTGDATAATQGGSC
jgi:hypothetical protein